MALQRKVPLGLVLALLAVLVTPALRAQTEKADLLFSRATAKARAEHKNALLVFSASWCGPCKLYEHFLEDPEMKAITEKVFVVQRFDVGERPDDRIHVNTPGAEALRTSLGAPPEPGFPFLVITDESGKPIVNSNENGKTGHNVGYPALPNEIDWYIQMLKRSAPLLSPQELDATRSWLQKHAPR